VTVPVRVAPGFGWPVIVAVPLPVVPPDVVKNDELLDAVQAQFDDVATMTSMLPPPLFTLTFVEDNVTTHPVGATSAAADCEKFTAVPLTVTLAERAAPVFAAMLNPTDPLPVPDVPEVMVRKVALLAALHEQVDAAVTGIVPVVAEAATLVVTLPNVTAQLDPDGVESLFEHATAPNAVPADARRASSRRWCLIMAAYSSPNPVRYIS
jgi:hypothetical protein